MPNYTLKNIKSGTTWDIFCSYSDLQKHLEDSDVVHIIGAPNMVSQSGSTLSKTSDGWKDLLKGIKKGSGKGNTIKT